MYDVTGRGRTYEFHAEEFYIEYMEWFRHPTITTGEWNRILSRGTKLLVGTMIYAAVYGEDPHECYEIVCRPYDKSAHPDLMNPQYREKECTFWCKAIYGPEHVLTRALKDALEKYRDL